MVWLLPAYSEKTPMHYTTPHYTALHYTTLHYSMQGSRIVRGSGLLVPAIPNSSNLIDIAVREMIYSHGRADAQVHELCGRCEDY